MAKGIQYINKKRQNRALKTGVALTDMAGDIATLGSRPLRSVRLQGAAVAADTSASLFRGQAVGAKQGGRKKGRRQERRVFGMFDASKSSDNKFKMSSSTLTSCTTWS